MLNSQLWGELRPVVLRKGLQPVTLSLCRFPTGLLFPIIASCMFDALVYSMPEIGLNVQRFTEKIHARPRTPAKDAVLCTPYEWIPGLLRCSLQGYHGYIVFLFPFFAGKVFEFT